MNNKIVVFGATGYAGGLVVDALLRQGARPVLAAYERDLLPAMATRLGGLDYQFADVNDPGSVRALVSPGDVLITTVGPFERFGRTAAQAAADVGAHYIDSTGETGFVRDLRERYDAQARETGATMLPAFGNDYVPGVLAASLALTKAGAAARSVQVGYFVTPKFRPETGLSQGTRKTIANEMTRPVTLWRNSKLEDVRAASWTRKFTVGGKSKRAFLASGTEVFFLPEEFPSLESVEVYNGWFPEMSLGIQMFSAAANVAVKVDAGKKIVDSFGNRFAGAPGGPDLTERSKTRSCAVAVTRDGAGKVLSEVHVDGPNVYTLTGELMAWAAGELAAGAARTPGVVGPVQAFGLDGLVQGAAKIGLTEIDTNRQETRR
ncbi:saccharopine dehydrogenase [Skermania sp. ID1734]|uniref:saccharopine dehydrogenase family protein n=1 Tax=Skermania sp. ID1734 TaxID=2597516 RepID=UPI00117CC918|nr:saccharopine dehydrogenase NADP-binding domain-containing protein [Skermania sp. ID1734]TSE00086.1 saccharopine dehydrogenase [Skermania sp. ID1734]